MGLGRNGEIKDRHHNDTKCPSQIFPCSRAGEGVRTAVESMLASSSSELLRSQTEMNGMLFCQETILDEL